MLGANGTFPVRAVPAQDWAVERMIEKFALAARPEVDCGGVGVGGPIRVRARALHLGGR